MSESSISTSPSPRRAACGLAHGLARHDHARDLGGALGQRHLDPGQAMAVGRHAAQHAGRRRPWWRAGRCRSGSSASPRSRSRSGCGRSAGRSPPAWRSVRQVAPADRREVVRRQGRQGEARAAGAERDLARRRRSARARPGRRPAACARCRRACGPARSSSPARPTSAGTCATIAGPCRWRSGPAGRRRPRAGRWTGSGWCCAARRRSGHGPSDRSSAARSIVSFMDRACRCGRRGERASTPLRPAAGSGS